MKARTRPARLAQRLAIRFPPLHVFVFLSLFVCVCVYVYVYVLVVCLLSAGQYALPPPSCLCGRGRECARECTCRHACVCVNVCVCARACEQARLCLCVCVYAGQAASR